MEQKRNIFIFIISALFAAIILLASLVSSLSLMKERTTITSAYGAEKYIWSIDNLKEIFNTDGIEGMFSSFLASNGLSSNFLRVVVGKEGFFYLGNAHDQSIERHSSDATRFLDNINHAVHYFDKRKIFLEKKGIPLFIISIPDKESLYPEYLPEWYRYHPTSPTDILFNQLTDQGFRALNFLPQLQDLKSNSLEEPLYYKGDTHWNEPTGYFAYVKTMELFFPNLKYFNEVRFQNKGNRKWGDIVKLLKIPITDTELITEDSSIQSILILICNLNADSLVEDKCLDTTNKSFISNDQDHVIYNKDALNNKKLLWFRDSFGGAQNIYYQGTFSTVIEVHPKNMDSFEDFKKLVNKYQPDYVLYSLSERNYMFYLKE